MSYDQPPDRGTDVPAEYPPGWYPDPGGLQVMRWWDGRQWSPHTQPLPEIRQEPQPQRPDAVSAGADVQDSFTGEHGSAGQYQQTEPLGEASAPEMTLAEQPANASQRRQSRSRWITRHAVLAVILAGGVGLLAGIGIGAAAHTTAVTEVKTSTVYETVPADTSTPTPTPTQSGPDMLTVGQSETLQDNSGATIGTLTVETVNVTTQSADGSGNAPVNGYFVVVHVKASADPSYTSGWYVSESDFYDLVNSQHYDNGNGNAFDALTSGQANSLSTQLAAGEATNGWLSFDVPGRHGEIVYAPNSNGQPIGEWSY